MRKRRSIGVATMDSGFVSGKAFGGVAERLLANNLDIEALRTNDVLLYDEWKQIDTVILKAARQRLVGVADLVSRGLTYPFDGLKKTVLGYQDAGEREAATLSMDGITRGRKDRPKYGINYLPLPIIHADFAFSIRELNESRNGNMPLDTTEAELSARQVAEKAEELLFSGSSSFTFGGGTIYGYTDEPQRVTYTLSVAWNASNADGETILADVLGMKQAAINDRHFGPWILYIPTAYETSVDDDFKTNSDKSIRSRLLEIAGLEDIKVADFLPANTVLLVQMTSDVVRLVEGLPITVVQWESEGGMQVNFKVMAIMVPQLRHDQNNRSGIVHGSV